MAREDPDQILLNFFRRNAKDYDFFCRNCVKIRNKQGELIPFIRNKAQQIISREYDEQMRTKQKLRVIQLKARQIGATTDVPIQFLHAMLHFGNINAFSLTDHSDHSKNVFNIFKRAFQNMPYYSCKTEKETSDEIVFEGINSSYAVGTARADNVGRGSTIQYCHLSEAAYYPNSEEHMAGIFQAVPHDRGTKIIIESTANGIGNAFHRICMEALDPKSEWRLIFIPWHFTSEYSLGIDPEDNLTLDPEEEELIKRYKLSEEQINWRRLKIRELGDIRKFRQEYPSTVEEAFLVDSDDSFITNLEISKANTPDDPIVADKNAPLVMGIDPSWRGKDDAAYCVRQGRIVVICEAFPKYDDSNDLINAIALKIKQFNPDKAYIDVGGPGGPIYDTLKSMSYHMIEDVNFGGSSEDPSRYANKRAEMYDRMKRWFNSPPCQIPDSQRLKMELTLTKWPTSGDRQKLLLAPKKDLKYSPNLADAMALTFASSVPSKYIMHQSNLLHNLQTKNKWDPYSIDF